LQSVLEERHFKVAVLDASVEPKKREAWVQSHCQDVDVLLANADLIKTGLDLYEFPTVVFYQISYNIFTLRQASRRTWRIGQTQPVRVLFFCYAGTMQSIALTLIAKKLEIALLVEGDLPRGSQNTAPGTPPSSKKWGRRCPVTELTRAPKSPGQASGRKRSRRSWESPAIRPFSKRFPRERV